MLVPRHLSEEQELLGELRSHLVAEVVDLLLVPQLTEVRVLHQHLQQVEQQELLQPVGLLVEQAG